MAMRLNRHVSLFESSIRRAIVPSVANPLCIRCRRYASSAAYPENIAVLGGGVSGLASAYFLAQEFPKSKITVYESNKAPGGWIKSSRVRVPSGDVLFEHGPRALRPGPESIVTQKLIQELGLTNDVLVTDQNAPGAANRYVYYPNRLQLLPGPNADPNWFSLLSSGIFAGIPKLMVEPFRPPRDRSIRDESIGSFITRRLDERPVQRLASAVFHGIYAGDVWKLSARTLLPMPWQLELKGHGVLDGWLKIGDNGKPGIRTFIVPQYRVQYNDAIKQEIKVEESLSKLLHNSSVFTFKNGLQQLIDILSKNLANNSRVNFKFGTNVKSFEPVSNKQQVQVATENGEPNTYDLVISTLRAPSLTPYVTVMSVNLYYTTPNLNPVKGFGYLIPQAVPFEQNPERALGVTFDSDATQGQDNAAGTKLTVMLGGHWWDDWTSYPDTQEGLGLALSVVERHLGITERPANAHVGLARDCIPQYTVGYEDRLRDHTATMRQKFGGRVRLVGNQYNGVAVNNCIEQAWMTARGLRNNGWKERATGLEDRLDDKPWIIGQEKKVED